MTTTEDTKLGELSKLEANMNRVEELQRRLLALIARHKPLNPGVQGPNQALFGHAAIAYWQEMMHNPAKIFEHQLAFWSKSVTHFMEAQKLLAQGKLEAPEDDSAPDRRFSNPLWKTNPYFNFLKRQYQINAEAMMQAVDDTEGLDDRERRRLTYFTQQIVDMMAPTNFLGSNPDALERAVETEGESLVKGLENLVRDLEANDGELVVRLADESAFVLGENVATTPGKVVWRNRMLELIQYAPTTETVHKTPLVIFPPWINKFYILDLKAQNSLIKWVVDQGYTLFVVSWVNPDASYADTSIEDYIEDGFLAAINEVKAITGEDQVNAVGYCIAGTMLSMTLALMKARGEKSVKSATFFTALTDFSDQGEFTPFLSDDFIDGLEAQIGVDGIIQSFLMARTFSFLRSNDLVYGPAIRNYMMGETPPAFDLLFWNGDGSNLPGRMAREYLRGLCQDNRFAEDGYDAFGETLKLRDVDVPLFAVTCETDHIAAWRQCYRGVQQMGSRSKTFVVSESGHIAGIVNPPSKDKYGHYTNEDLKGDAAAWMDGADYHTGSWWPRWEAWLKKRSGRQVPARTPGGADHPALADAPGLYVSTKARRH